MPIKRENWIFNWLLKIYKYFCLLNMSIRKKNHSYKNISHTCKTLAGSMVLILWMLVFFAGSVKASVAPVKLAKSVKTVLATKTSQPDQSNNPSEPLPLPEDPENSIAELEDGADDDKKAGFTTYFLQLIALQQTTLIQAVQSFHYNQAIQQRIAIPLFVLHHSWKSYLI